ncbi:MAG TPA: hypothetical protein VG816_00910 [Solirubrobacterales bacterium]|nr:hypothetical protein [Solirubrobacterales bacterium]
MSAQPVFSSRPAAMGAWAPWLLRREFWGGITLVVVWLSVLFTGIFGGNIENADAGGGSSSVPVVVVVSIAALLATVSIGRWAFGPPRDSEPGADR